MEIYGICTRSSPSGGDISSQMTLVALTCGKHGSRQDPESLCLITHTHTPLLSLDACPPLSLSPPQASPPQHSYFLLLSTTNSAMQKPLAFASFAYFSQLVSKLNPELTSSYLHFQCNTVLKAGRHLLNATHQMPKLSDIHIGFTQMIFEGINLKL